eukprot:CAMPEP_0206608320 /NCGR_PEP_ID=MMETSP0325_2-20121206/52918_1 /ASSEMBLY_ACC=CAM_ASM_000347 /TAXON_ID=2866 /ORGANISM="Crypthecodinium cohnii, Strain Seligo" /LENGTH=178 /DNA_ID=CAMNT_0054125987 /DNA_START=200 /DNA_END=734 /DNA_ORIENTATION=+
MDKLGIARKFSTISQARHQTTPRNIAERIINQGLKLAKCHCSMLYLFDCAEGSKELLNTKPISPLLILSFLRFCPEVTLALLKLDLVSHVPSRALQHELCELLFCFDRPAIDLEDSPAWPHASHPGLQDAPVTRLASSHVSPWSPGENLSTTSFASLLVGERGLCRKLFLPLKLEVAV